LAADVRQALAKMATAYSSAAVTLGGIDQGRDVAAEFAPYATSAEQQWALVPDATPNGSQTLQIHGLSLRIPGEHAGRGDHLHAAALAGQHHA
jgi:hypothetical protein